MKIWKRLRNGILFLAFCCMIPAGCYQPDTMIEGSAQFATELEAAPPQEESEKAAPPQEEAAETAASDTDIPAYSGEPYVTVNNNVPQFLDAELSTVSYEYYSDLDELGRCGVVYACIGTDLMPTEERGNIGPVKPSGWHTIKYSVVDGNYLYNRCHLIGYQLSGENDNVKNLITGTRYMNVEGMLPFENRVADYVRETKNHVMYRVTPVFDGDNLLVNGVQIEAQSVEDDGGGISFNVYCYNVQPGIGIDYATGDSWLVEAAVEAPASTEMSDAPATMVWRSATGNKYHSRNDCGKMNPDQATQITEEEAVREGLEKCGRCW